ncbi:MAG: helix-turn-helix transcriptional regulator [Paracoccaceae bacterium]
MYEDQESSATTMPENGMDIIASWVEALHSHGLLSDAIGNVSKIISAEAALLVRHSERNFGSRLISIHDPASKKLSSQNRRSFAFDIFNDYLVHMKVGAQVTLQELAKDHILGREEITDFHDKASIYGVRDVALICLANGPGSLDVLEFHFKSEMRSADRTLLTLLAGTLARSWKSRLPGIAVTNIIQLHTKNRGIQTDSTPPPILHQSNPCSLSRCEYRVCVLVREGMLAKSIAKQLGVSDSTIRSHLRSIYMKTESSCHVELLHLLNSRNAVETVKDGSGDAVRHLQTQMRYG